ncbi:MAG TPA: transglutaminase domain-containing protein [Chitinophagaceae bacterium]
MRKTLTVICILYSGILFSQEQPIKFGKVSAVDLQKTVYSVDTSAEAVILADIGSTRIKGNAKGWFSLEFKRHRRIHILKKSGYDHATVEIPLYADGEDEEVLDNLKVVTYNYENGKLVETKLDVKSAVFKEKLDRNRVIKKFTFPNVKEGSIIEYEYRLTSDFLFNLQPWYFQDEVPALWSEYTVSLPAFLKYMLISQGSQTFFFTDQKSKRGDYSVEMEKKNSYGVASGAERINISCGVTDFRWAMKDVPPLKEESYTTTLLNYMSKLEFQLAAYLDPLTPETLMSTWPDLTQRLIKREDFGMEIENAGTWIPGILPSILKNASTDLEKAKKIFSYLQDNFTCTDRHQLYTEKNLKAVFDKKNGGVAEINLLLTAMLRYAGINADPVILSRRPYGFVYDRYPVIGRFNYVISRAMINGGDVLLDASRPQSGFGKLGFDCYNGTAKVVNEQATSLSLTAAQLTEKENVTVRLSTTANGEWKGNVSKLYGYYESEAMRGSMKTGDQEELKKTISKQYDNDVKIENFKMDSATVLEAPLRVSYDIAYNNEMADIIYMGPIITGRLKNNPFKSADRLYPVEMPYKIDESYSFILTIPEGYIADELPKPVTFKMNEAGDAIFEYAVSRSSDNTIKVQYKLETKKTFFQTTEYDTLREFYNLVVAKQAEQIVLKKRK